MSTIACHNAPLPTNPHDDAIRRKRLAAFLTAWDDTPSLRQWQGRALQRSRPLEWFGGNRTQEFCRMEFTVPDRVEDYLTRLYDDYMQLPPIEQRKSHHCFEAFWKENAHE